jgi:hypothetical protein
LAENRDGLLISLAKAPEDMKSLPVQKSVNPKEKAG